MNKQKNWKDTCPIARWCGENGKDKCKFDGRRGIPCCTRKDKRKCPFAKKEEIK